MKKYNISAYRGNLLVFECGSNDKNPEYSKNLEACLANIGKSYVQKQKDMVDSKK